MRRPRLPRTLRGRLVAVLTLVLTVAFAAAALVSVLVVQHVLNGRLDAQLRAAGDRFSVGLEHDDHDADNRYGSVEGQAAGTLGARLYQGRVTDAAIVGDHETADQLPAGARARLARLGVDANPRSVELPGLGEYRVIVTAGRDHDLQVTGLPVGPVEDTIDRLVLVELAVFAGTLVVVALASTGLVRVMLRPIARIAGTAAEVSALPLQSGLVSLPRPLARDASGGSEVDTLARAFDAMLVQVESALTTRAESEDRLRRFIADASHELRTPVAVVRSHAELAQRAVGPEQVAHSLERITAQAERMGHLVEDLLLLARLDSGRPLAHEPVDIVRLAVETVDDVRATATGHHWRLDLPERSVWLAGDRHVLARALANLVANAAVHTPPGTTVTVTVDDRTAGRVRLAVSDDGPGMATAVADRAFDRFVRGEKAPSLGRGSSGLGLPIVAAIVAAHDSTITLSTGEHGTTVEIVVPAGDSDPTGTGERTER